MKKMKKTISLLLALITVSAFIVSCNITPDTTDTSPSDITDPFSTDGVTTAEEIVVKPNDGGVVLSELMASNKTVIADDYGTYSDWIELYNSSDAPINLKNYMISDNPGNPAKFIMPDVTIGAGEYLIIWASGRNVYNEATGNLHLSFKINYISEIISLFSPQGVEIGRITVNNLPQDVSAGPDANGRTMKFSEPTPGAKNTEAPYVPPVTTVEEPLNTGDADINTLRINEFATKDCITFADSEGEYGAWAELYNYGDADVSVKGLFLSDDETDPFKWAFPDVTVPAGKYIIVFMMGNEREYTEGGEIQATFTLSGSEATLGIYNGVGDIIDICPVYDMMANITCGRSIDDSSKWLFFPKATPAADNTVKGFEDIESARHPAYKTVYISEVVAVNTTLETAPDGKTYSSGELSDYYDLYDYIELYNASSGSINLSDFYVGKNTFESALRLPDVVLGAGEYRLVYFADETAYSAKTDKIFVNIGLNRYRNDLYIFDKVGLCVDSVLVGMLFDNTSAGRVSSSDDTLYYFTDVTPGTANSTVTYSKAAPSPAITVEGGYIDAGTEIKITAPSGCVIYYTTDGSEPSTSSSLYTSPVVISQTCTLRARAYKSGSLPSEDVSASYVIGRDHGLPVIFLSTDAKNLYSEKTGIFAEGADFDSRSSVYVGNSDTYSSRENAFFNNANRYANFWQDWERPVHFDYIDEDGKQVLSFNAGIKVFGQYSRVHDQKSVAIKLRDKYGIKEVVYPFFGENYINVFSSIILRASGQDANAAHIRDAFVAKALVGEINCEVMNYEPVVVYINGEYFGIYDLREHISEDFVADHTGADAENLDIMKGTSIVLSGSSDNYKELFNYCTSNNLANADNYAYVCSKMDIDNYIDYWIAQIYFANTDPGNIKFYREKTDGAKWRWIPYDFDWSTRSTENRFSMALRESTMKVYSILRALMKNETFKQKFLSRFCELLNTTLNPDRLLPLLRELTNQIAPEMEYHIEKWNYRWDDENELLYLMCSSPYTMANWEKNIVRIEDWIANRDTVIIKDMKAYFKLSDSDVAALGYKG